MKKLASGWNDSRLPGQFFPSKKDLLKRLAVEKMPFSNDRTIDFKRPEPPAWQGKNVHVIGDMVYDGQDPLLRIPDPAARDEFMMDYSTAPEDQKVNIFNQWRNRLRGAEEQAGKAPPPPERRLRSGGGEDEETEVDTENWHARAYVKRIFVPGKEDRSKPLPGQKEKKPGTIPVYHRGIELTHKPSGEVIKFPLTVRGGVATFGDSRPHKEMQIRPRYKPSELVELLTKWVGDQNARMLVDSAMGGMTSYFATQASSRWVSVFCKFAQAPCNHSREESWWESDAQGIPLARVCDRCVKASLSKFNPAVLTDEQREMLGVRGRQPAYRDVVEEPIEPEGY